MCDRNSNPFGPARKWPSLLLVIGSMVPMGIGSADTIYLKSGEKIEGTNLEFGLDSTSIESSDGSRVAYPNEKVDWFDTTSIDADGYDQGLLKQGIRFKPPAGWVRSNEAKDVQKTLFGERFSFGVHFYRRNETRVSLVMSANDEGYYGMSFKGLLETRRALSNQASFSEEEITFAGVPCHVFVERRILPKRDAGIKSYVFKRGKKIYEILINAPFAVFESEVAALDETIRSFEFVE